MHLTTIPIFASECEKEFSEMNLIISLTKALLRMKLSQHVCLSLFLYHSYFNPRKYIHSGMVPSVMHSALNTNSKEQTQGVLSYKNVMKIRIFCEINYGIFFTF
jgi:hypothetical protein